MTEPLAVGSAAPDFSLESDAGDIFTLSEKRGHPVVLFFYPQDDTEGCTIENLEFTRLAPDFQKAGVILAGISPDTVEAHCKFRDKYELGIPLLADPDKAVINAYQVWGPKKLFGNEYDGLIRTTYLIDGEGRIAHVWTVRKIEGHATDVLEAAKALS